MDPDTLPAPAPAHSAFDPVSAFFQGFASNAGSGNGANAGGTDLSETHSTTGFSFHDDLDDSLDFPPPSSTPGPQNGLYRFSGMHGLKDLCRVLKSRAELGEKAEAELDSFMTASEPEQRLMQFSAMLQIREHLKQVFRTQTENFEISDKLKDNIKSYTRAFLLSPQVTAYRGNNAQFVLNTMRELNVQDVPDEKQVAHCRAVLALIGGHLTNFRSVIKEKIKQSLLENSSIQNIAELTFSLAGQASIQVTLQHYIRMAFLRWAYIVHKDVPDDQFWTKIDETLNGLRSQAASEVALTTSFHNMYEADKVKYGDPADTPRRVVEPTSIVNWQTALARNSLKVQGQSKKRKTRAT